MLAIIALNSGLHKYYAQATSETCDSDNKDSYYTMRVLEIPHIDDVGVKHVQTVPHRTVLEWYARCERLPIF
jgi:hypothetical protein